MLIGTRGQKEAIDLFIKELSSKYVPLPIKNIKTGKIINVANPIHVRPMQIWDIVFPKECLDVVLNTIFPEKSVHPDHPKFRKWYNWLLRLLPLKEIPTDWKDDVKLSVNVNSTERVGFGIKEDNTEPFKHTDEQMKALGLDPKEEWEFESL